MFSSKEILKTESYLNYSKHAHNIFKGSLKLFYVLGSNMSPDAVGERNQEAFLSRIYDGSYRNAPIRLTRSVLFLNLIYRNLPIWQIHTFP